MASRQELFSTIDSALSSPYPPSPGQRILLMSTIRSALPLFQSLLCYPGPKASDRSQVQSKEVRLPDSPLISLDDMDVQIALKLSEDLNLNEIECVNLLVNTNKEWILSGREPLEIYRLAAGLWYTERRHVIMSLHTLLRAVVLERGLETDLLAEIQRHLEDLFKSGLRERLIALIKELNREEPVGFGGPHAERHLIDFRGAIVERKAVISQERLLLSHCLVLSMLVSRMGPKDAKNLLAELRDFAANVDDHNDCAELQISFSVMFSLVIAFVSDALSINSSKAFLLSSDATFRKEFHKLVMTTGNSLVVEGFVNVVRLAWIVHLIYTQDQGVARELFPDTDERELINISACLQIICSKNVFHFLLTKVLQTPAYQNDEEDVVYVYDGYMHKLMMCFLSHPFTRGKVKEMKEKAMATLDPYISPISAEHGDSSFLLDSQIISQPFASILELVGEVYKRQPELLLGNEDLWAFVNFAGEDHTNIPTLVAFLRMLKTLASIEEGASKVFELLQGKTLRKVGWDTLFDCLSIYDEKFRQSMLSSGAPLPDIQEGDAQALVAYLNVLRKVVENGDPTERKKWFSDIEPLFKLLSYENVPPYLKGALRDAISSFIGVSAVMKDTIWSYLEKYDLPVVVGPPSGNGGAQLPSQVYDMRFELNEVEARRERYPSTISFLNLLNALISQEKDVSDRGHRFVGIFRFVYDHIFGPYTQRAYADPREKWQLVIACLQHFHLVLSMYDIREDDIGIAVDVTHHSSSPPSTLEMQLPVLELMKDFMSGKVVFRNIMGIISSGVNSLINDRTSQAYGFLLEKTIHLSLEIIIIVFERDLLFAEYWRPLFQPFDVILSQDPHHIVSLLEYVQYHFLPQIQLCSIKIAHILSLRMVGLVQLLLKANAAGCLIEDYAACLENHFDESVVIGNTKDDAGVLIMQLLIDNISRPAPNISHLLLKFDLDGPVEKTQLQPKYQFSCLKVILENLDKLLKPEVNALLHEFGFQLLYELCLDPLTADPTMDLLSTRKYQFFSKHVENIGVAPLPRRNNNQPLRISSLHQRAWLLKLLAFEMHSADMAESSHRETCMAILSNIFAPCFGENLSVPDLSKSCKAESSTFGGVFSKIKALELLESFKFKPPDIAMRFPQFILNLKYHTQIEDILRNPTTSEMGGVYYYSERGDRLIDLDAFHDRIWQILKVSDPHSVSRFNVEEKGELKQAVQQLLRWAWKYNKNLEEQAAQLHMLTGWSQIVEASLSRKILFIDDQSQLLFKLLDASLSASASFDCSLKMALMLSHVSLTCMAKLRDERYLCPRGLESDSVTCLDIISTKQLPNGACHSILFKLMMAILRNESSEALRRRQYALLLSYFQYCRSVLDPDIPASVLEFLLCEEQGDDELNLQKIDKDQAELARANFSVLKKDAEAVINLVTKDAMEGSEAGKAMAFYVLETLVSIDQDKFFLGQLQSKGIFKSSLLEITNSFVKDGQHSMEALQRLCTLQAQLSLLLRVSHKYKKHGAQFLLSIGALEHLGSCRVMNLHAKGFARQSSTMLGRGQARDVDEQSLLVTPILRLVSSLTLLVDSSEFLEVKNKIVREVMDFIKQYQLVFDQILRQDILTADDVTLERINLVVFILSRVWPYEESNECGFLQGIFSMMNFAFQLDFGQISDMNKSKSELIFFRLCFSFCSYIYFLVTKKLLRLQVSSSSSSLVEAVDPQQPTLVALVHLLDSLTTALARAAEEKFLLLSKIRNINELSRQEVDEIIDVCLRHNFLSSHDNIRKRRFIAMVEMCHMVGNRDQLITVLLELAECLFNILLIHFQDDDINLGDISLLCGTLRTTLERLEHLTEVAYYIFNITEFLLLF
ncbi:hypothetical protein AXF42_Ash007319 [Apostasia shenzhenica]|uniref:Nuclear pore complex protein NUP205 n=1 Tax=Apostasia shenzhenica TaxID=1088818 RepID=A0A2I0B9V0_9ASPA|nr:hypothetical protein AXF42_Ash007319 [Apostasia shenzhenica]